MSITASVVTATNSVPSSNYLDVSEPFAIVTNLNTSRTVYLNGSDTFNAGTGFPVRPGESVSVPVVGSQRLYTWAEDPLGSTRINVLHQN